MKIYKNFKIEKKFQNSAIAIGNFDGFHLGHQRVIKKGKQIAKRKNLKFGLMVFQPLPVMFFNKKLKNKGIILRSTEEGYKIKNMLRLSIGSVNDNLKFMSAVTQVFKK